MKQWMYKKCNADTAAIAKRYNISEVFARVLVNRDFIHGKIWMRIYFQTWKKCINLNL